MSLWRWSFEAAMGWKHLVRDPSPLHGPIKGPAHLSEGFNSSHFVLTLIFVISLPFFINNGVCSLVLDSKLQHPSWRWISNISRTKQDVPVNPSNLMFCPPDWASVILIGAFSDYGIKAMSDWTKSKPQGNCSCNTQMFNFGYKCPVSDPERVGLTSFPHVLCSLWLFTSAHSPWMWVPASVPCSKPTLWLLSTRTKVPSPNSPLVLTCKTSG